MSLENLGRSLREALNRVLKASRVDRDLVKSLVNDLVRSLLQADVQVELVIDLAKRVESRALNEKPPPGFTEKEYLVKIVYDEIVKLLGGESVPPFMVKPGKLNVYMLVGLQGSGKTTTACKLALYYQKRGVKSGLICADVYRPGAYQQLKQLGDMVNIPVYGELNEKDPVKISLNGLKFFREIKRELVIIDTAGRHKDEESLMREVSQLYETIKPDEVILTIDATIGQQAYNQAKAFHETVKVGSIIVTKMDGSARGGGALSAIAATGAPIRLIGVGEKIEDLEVFNPRRFVARLLGFGDIEGLIEKFKQAEVRVSEKEAKEVLTGKFTLEEFYKQMESLRKMGPLKSIISHLPGFAYSLPNDSLEEAESKMDRWKAIIESMTREERVNPRILNSSRIRRIARGAGVSERDVKDLVKYYEQTVKLLKAMRGRRGLLRIGKLLGSEAS
ncbi:signal recognition particle protein Srp54 [Candidatus Bathyarchaeota archaeon]|nr:signal recognition particle protein Srp54 [Candidatus Bathyarchaeota archaeon]